MRLPGAPKRILSLGLLVLSLSLLLGVSGDEGRFDNLGHKLMCACSCNQVLLECNHVGCTYSSRMRDELAASVSRGDSDDLTLQAFVQKYGPTVLIAPTTTGFNRVAWVVPYLVLVLGLATVVLTVRAWRNRPLLLPEGAVAPASGTELLQFREQARKDTDL
jgi:cytochrome c-type biogenesis protein CcmH/NrfF